MAPEGLTKRALLLARGTLSSCPGHPWNWRSRRNAVPPAPVFGLSLQPRLRCAPANRVEFGVADLREEVQGQVRQVSDLGVRALDVDVVDHVEDGELVEVQILWRHG